MDFLSVFLGGERRRKSFSSISFSLLLREDELIEALVAMVGFSLETFGESGLGGVFLVSSFQLLIS
jgi:hypothetical protein